MDIVQWSHLPRGGLTDHPMLPNLLGVLLSPWEKNSAMMYIVFSDSQERV